jgi:hypothetical protein
MLETCDIDCAEDICLHCTGKRGECNSAQINHHPGVPGLFEALLPMTYLPLRFAQAVSAVALAPMCQSVIEHQPSVAKCLQTHAL